MTDTDYLKKKQSLEKQLKENNKGKLRILWAIFVTITGPFLAPFMKSGNRWSKETFSTTFGYWNSVLLFGGIMLLVMPYLIYQEHEKTKRKRFDIERELRILENDKKQ